MRKSTLYIDTSIVGGYFDDEWRFATRELWRQMELGEWHFFSSPITKAELAAAPPRVVDLFNETFGDESLVAFTPEVELLARTYVSKGVVSPKYIDDARHVAAHTVARLDYLVSWNFKHMVNVHREAGFNAVNLLQNYPSVRIVNPLALIYGTQT
jgi:hypothetical protein